MIIIHKHKNSMILIYNNNMLHICKLIIVIQGIYPANKYSNI